MVARLADRRIPTGGVDDPDDAAVAWLPIKLVPALVVAIIMFAVVVAARALRSEGSKPAPTLVFAGNDTTKNERLTLPADSLFDYDRADLKATALPAIHDFATNGKARTEVRIVVIGHTDPLGTAAHNDRLSLARAEAVRKALVAEGVSAESVSVAGVGSRIPQKKRDECLGPDRAPSVIACLAPNRRVELWAKDIGTPPN